MIVHVKTTWRTKMSLPNRLIIEKIDADHILCKLYNYYWSCVKSCLFWKYTQISYCPSWDCSKLDVSKVTLKQMYSRHDLSKPLTPIMKLWKMYVFITWLRNPLDVHVDWSFECKQEKHITGVQFGRFYAYFQINRLVCGLCEVYILALITW